MTDGPRPSPLDGVHKVNHGLQVTVFTLLFGVAIPIMALQEVLTQGWQSQLLIVLAGVVAGPPAWFVMREARFLVIVGPGGIEARSIIGERRRLPWDSIHSVEYASFSKSLVFRAGEGGEEVVLRVSLLRKGIEALGRAIPHYLPRPVWDGAWKEMFGTGRG